MIIGYDSATPTAIPRAALAVGGYVDGYAWTAQDWGLFPRAVKWTISIHGNDADELDVENGAATVAMIPGWVRRQLARLPSWRKVGVYCSKSTLPDCQRAAATLGGDATRVVYRGAWYDAGGQLIPGCWATQTAAPGFGSPGDYDLNTIVDLSWLVDTQPAQEDFLMALSDAQQAQMYNWLGAVVGAVEAIDAAKDPAGHPIDDHWTLGYLWGAAKECPWLLFGAPVKTVPAGRPDVTVGEMATCVTDGVWFRWIQTPQEAADFIGIVAGADFRVPVYTHTAKGRILGAATPDMVADPLAFGRPQDKTTADLLGLPYP